MKTIRWYVVFLLVLMCGTAAAEEPLYPDYVRSAQNIVEKAASKSLEVNSFTDEILIARNYIRSSEAEYKKHLGWSGKLAPVAEPTVRYFASMAEIQASIVLARAGKLTLDRERSRLEQQLTDVKSKIKIFDDKNAEIVALKKGITELNSALLVLKEEKEQLSAKFSTLGTDMTAKSTALTMAERRVTTLSSDVEHCSKALTAAEAKITQVTAEKDQALAETARIKADLAALAAAKGASESQSKEQIDALNRQSEFVSEIGKLGGVIKSGSGNMTVIFVRSGILKSPKNDALSTAGDKVVVQLAELLKKYPEYRVKLKVHGFGQPARNEDAAATDRMARLIREALVEKGKLEPAVVESLGAGSADPIYPKSNPEGNRRVEITFVKK